MSDYAPDEELSRDYVEGWAAAGSANPAGDAADVLHLIAKIKADAWDECARSAGDMASPLMDQNPYRRDEA